MQKQTVIFEENPKWRNSKGIFFCQIGPKFRRSTERIDENIKFSSIIRCVERRNFELVPQDERLDVMCKGSTGRVTGHDSAAHNYRDNSKARTGSLETLFFSDVLFVN